MIQADEIATVGVLVDRPAVVGFYLDEIVVGGDGLP